ncbi:hypothetical protein [Metabacillus fastidiosus]|uniref:hypothetical protein n=1 Tax=Metabacillus fastidiosus TaxID=1458 RepID=UPI003D298A6A
MPKIQYKHVKGALHIGGGRFFHANEPVTVSAEEKEELLELYGDDLEEIEDKQDETDGKYTKTSIKKLSADEQKVVITSLNGDPAQTNNEEERIALILELQEKAGE